MKVKEIDKTANIAWSPANQHPIYIAAGTAAQQLDATFSTTSTLDLYALNLADPTQEMEAVGSVTSEYRFNKFVWGPFGVDNKSSEAGLLIGGAEAGKVFIWDAAKLIAKKNPLIHTLDKHNGPVAALDLNPFQKNLLATGASDSEIFIWDLASPDKVMTPGNKVQPSHDVSCLTWNRQVQHILASAQSGICMVWDLRKNESIIKIRDSMSRLRCNTICWHPEIATQLCLASEDDHSPVIQLWDLRSATSPIKVLENHTRGVLSLAWCPNDPDLLLSCSKDSRVLCWNPNAEVAGQVVYELPNNNQWCFDVQWCPRIPSLISYCSFDGHVGVHSLMGGSPPTQTSSKVAEAFNSDPFLQPLPQQHLQQHSEPVMLKKPPRWLKRPAGASFAFGGKLVCFDNPKSAASTQQQQPSHVVTVSQVVTDTELVSRSTALQKAIAGGRYLEFCESKIHSSKDKHETEIWQFLKANFESDPQQQYLELLGYSEAEVTRRVEAALQKDGFEQLDNSSSSAELNHTVSTDDDDDDDESSDKEVRKAMEQANIFDKIAKSDTTATAAAHATPLPITISSDCEGLITQALLAANFEAAVDVCIHHGRMAEAIILAAAGGTDLMMKTQKRFFQSYKSHVNQLIAAVINRKFEQVVQTCDLNSWKEVLAFCLTYTEGNELSDLCNMLGYRLESEVKTEELKSKAHLCYIIAGNTDRLVASWNTNSRHASLSLQTLVEKVMILHKAAGSTTSHQSGGHMEKSLCEYSRLLATQGCLDTALSYLEAANDAASLMLRNQLYNAMGKGVTTTTTTTRLQQQQQQQQQQQRIMSAQQRSRTSSATYGVVNPVEQTSFVNQGYPAGTNYVPSTPPYSRNAVSSEFMYPTTNVNSNPATSSRGVLSQRYPQTSAVSTATGVTPQLYDPTGYTQTSYMSSTQYTPSQMIPGAPNTVTGIGPAVAHTSESFQMFKPSTAWNDPPVVRDSIKEKPQIPTSTPITAPVPGAVPDQGPPGAPQYNQFYNPQEYDRKYQQEQQAIQAAQEAERNKPVVEKGPIPQEHSILQNVFDRLVELCFQQAPNMQMKKKLEDVARKLEVLYDKLRDCTLSPTTISGIHHIAQAIQQCDYQTAQGYYSQIASSGSFTEISAFMPGIKVLVQSALQLQVYLQ